MRYYRSFFILIVMTSILVLNGAIPVWADHGTPLDIDDNTWVVRTLPPKPHSLMGGGAKHVNFEVSADDHMLYVQGGDGSNYTLSNGQTPSNSDRQEVYTYDVKRDVWTLVHPYCAGPGEVAPAYPDWGPWIWDSNRNKFWYFGGGGQCFSGSCNLTQLRDVTCGGISDSTTVYTDRQNHWYNITTHQYETPSVNGHDSTNIQEILGRTVSNNLSDGIYDPVKDDFWLPVGCNWVCVYRYDPSTDTNPGNISTSGWTKFEFKGKSWEFVKSHVTWDPTRRNMYIITSSGARADGGGTADHLLRFNIDDQTLTDLGKLPGPVSDLVDQSIIYNSVEDVLMFPQFDEAQWAHVQLYIYHLGGAFAGKWQGVDMTADVEVHGRHWVYEAFNNVLVGASGSADHKARMFIYRYVTPPSLHPFDEVAPGHWYRVQNSKAYDVRPDKTKTSVDPHGRLCGKK